MSFLLQPIKGIRGIKNDLDEGVPFWPKSVTTRGELVDYHHAYLFLEYFDKLPNPAKELQEFIESM